MKDTIKRIIADLGADLCGIANIDRFENAPSGFHPRDLYSDCQSVIVFVKRMPTGLSYVSPRILYNKATDINLYEVDRIGYLACLEIENIGGVAVPLPSDSPYEYWDSDRLEGRGLLSMRHAAQLAGIGSMGKNSLIINERFGNMINIGAILTNLDLESDPLAPELCLANCRRCLDSCPQQALSGLTVNQKECRVHTYTQNDRGFSVCNCNQCRLVCPLALGVKGKKV